MDGIVIHRDFQIIDGFVQLPPNFEKDRNSYNEQTVVDNLVSGIGADASVVITVGKYKMIRLPAVNNGYTDINGNNVDPVDVMK